MTRLPQSEWPAFRVPTCSRCGHPEGDHRNAVTVVALAPVRGACLRTGCDCTRYVEEAELREDLETLARCLEVEDDE